MNIAILRTDAGDIEYRCNGVEHAAAYHGARVAAYVDFGGATAYRGLPAISPARLATLDIDLVVAPTALTTDLIETLQGAGWPSERLLSFATHARDCVAWFKQGRWLSVRTPAMATASLQMTTTDALIQGIAAGPVAPALPAPVLRAVSARVFDSFLRARRDAPESGPYAAGRNWREFMKSSRPGFYRAVEQRDVAAITDLLADCLRNEMTTGMFGGTAAHEAYRGFVRAGEAVIPRLRQDFNVWRYSVAQPDLRRIASPAVGNPYGVRVDGGIIHGNTFLNDSRAGVVSGLVRHVERPVVLDLGGGFGGFGHQLFTNNFSGVYVGVDLPENLMVASYFLSVAHPDKRILLYESGDQSLGLETLRDYDIVMMPNFMLPAIEAGTVDVFTNFISLSEMDYATIGEYLRQVERVCRGYFYHENLIENGHGYESYPVGTFPEMTTFTKVFAAPSRWSCFSASDGGHCHGEFLLMNRAIDHARYLTEPSVPPVPQALPQAA